MELIGLYFPRPFIFGFFVNSSVSNFYTLVNSTIPLPLCAFAKATKVSILALSIEVLNSIVGDSAADMSPWKSLLGMLDIL